MIHFNELRITNDSKYLIIDASVDNDECLENMTIDNIVIDTQDTYISNGPSSNPIITIDMDNYYGLDAQYKKVLVNDNCEYSDVVVENENCYVQEAISVKRNIRVNIELTSYGITSEDMLFVYLIPNEVPSCYNIPYVMSTVVNLYPVYQDIMDCIREVECDCKIHKYFIDRILRFKALELCIRTGNYPLAIKYWNKFFKSKDHEGIDTII